MRIQTINLAFVNISRSEPALSNIFLLKMPVFDKNYIRKFSIFSWNMKKEGVISGFNAISISQSCVKTKKNWHDYWKWVNTFFKCLKDIGMILKQENWVLYELNWETLMGAVSASHFGNEKYLNYTFKSTAKPNINVSKVFLVILNRPSV